ncbi:MAG: hypothetical protein WC817_00015 [Patescibacteria group bacterium]|jgi:hypothetical protein
MQEKNVSMEDAFQVWWFIFWRTFLTIIGISIVLTLLLTITGSKESVGTFVNPLALLISIVTQVFYTKSAINRRYKKFRLSATENI